MAKSKTKKSVEQQNIPTKKVGKKDSVAQVIDKNSISSIVPKNDILIITQNVVRPIKLAHPRRHSVAQTAGDVISSSTVRPNERLSVLSQFSDGSQSDSMEPRPEFCRNLRRARHQYDYAQKLASEKENSEKDSSDAASASKK